MVAEGNAATRRRKRANPGRFRAFLYAVLVHVVVISVLFIGFQWTSRRSGNDTPVQAVVVNEAPAKKVQKPPEPPPDETLRRQQEEAERKAAEERRRAEAELKRKQEEEARRQAEAKRKQEEERKARELALKRKQEEERKAREEAERKQRAEEEKRRAEEEKRRAAEAKRKQEEEARRQAEQALKQQLAAEERSRQEAERAARAAAAAESYKELIKQKVSRNWSVPLGARKGLTCVVRVRLVPGGEVLQATVVRSSGDPVFDRSVENAVHKASPLPLPQDPTLFDYLREIEFLFNPEQ